MASRTWSARGRLVRHDSLLASAASVLRPAYARMRLTLGCCSPSPAAPNVIFEPLEGRRMLSVVTTTEMYPWAVDYYGKNGKNEGTTTATPVADSGVAPVMADASFNNFSGYSGYYQYDNTETPTARSAKT